MAPPRQLVDGRQPQQWPWSVVALKLAAAVRSRKMAAAILAATSVCVIRSVTNQPRRSGAPEVRR